MPGQPPQFMSEMPKEKVYLKHISLANFKNYPALHLELEPGINAILGENGSGKTNLLDAIHYLSMTKSAFGVNDQQTIRHQQEYYTVEGNFEEEGEEVRVFCGQQKGQKKILKLNKSPYPKFSEHIGRFPCILIAPNDQNLIYDASEVRRKFWDACLSQLDGEYLRDLMAYNHFLRQRNQLLKLYLEKNSLDIDLLDTYDVNLCQLGFKVYQKRQELLQNTQASFQEYYQFVSEQRENAQIEYRSQLHNTEALRALREYRDKDMRFGRTHFGIHRDDYLFTINGYPLKRFGSQGQQKSFLIALKITQFGYLADKKKLRPILLLDDIFDKLDDRRIKKLMELMAGGLFGQIFMSDARPERSKEFLANLPVSRKEIVIDQGGVQKEMVYGRT